MRWVFLQRSVLVLGFRAEQTDKVFYAGTARHVSSDPDQGCRRAQSTGCWSLREEDTIGARCGSGNGSLVIYEGIDQINKASKGNRIQIFHWKRKK